MSAVLQHPAIKFLSPQLADQIAAGEVIERPASVLKELIENALDAHCNRIDIDMSAGGMEHIRVTDNGDGIPCAELPMAISRHATSKLSSMQDLLALQTLGFRGEALASICSVSQWQLISCNNEVAQACKLTYAMASLPAADHHPQGTTVQVDNLFHNVPARRKFLRAERTEFRHCDDVIRRMALARFDVGFFVKHNGRQVHRLPAVTEDIGRTRRVAQICGEQFIHASLAIEYQHDGMRLWGWMSTPAYSRQQTDLQYFYINGRVVRDRMINHAIRLAYQHCLPTGRQAAYVLHLEIEPDRFDVNVHPTKQEVRFRETRMVHDFLSRSLRQALHTGPQPVINMASDAVNEAAAGYHYKAMPERNAHKSAGDYRQQEVRQPIHGVLFDRFVFAQLNDKTVLVDLVSAYAHWASRYWYQQYTSGNVITRPLLIPERLPLGDHESAQLEKHAAVLVELGLDLSFLGANEAILRYMPAWLAGYAHRELITAILQSAVEVSERGLCEVLMHCALDQTSIDTGMLLAALASEPNIYAQTWREMSTMDLARFFA